MGTREKFMRLAIELAKRGRTSPNPRVGCVVVKNGQIIGRGYHREAGLPHAEIEALNDVKRRGREVRDATMYLTLEPCSSMWRGKRTPPCTGAILESGVSELIVAMRDPNPKVSGRGIAFLRKNGVKTKVGLLEGEAKELNEAYAKWVSTGMPLVIMKMAMSADGKIATRTGDSKWVSGEESRRLVHRMRSEIDAVMVGAGTVKKDDPRLTARIKGGRNPIRVIVDSDLCLDPRAKFMDDGKVIIATTESAKKQKSRIAEFESLGASILYCGKQGVDLKKLMRELGEFGIQSVLMEGGSELNGSAMEAGIVDKIFFFIAPKIVGGNEAKGPIGGKGIEKMSRALKLKDMKIEKIGEDWLLSAWL
jgi:diaminohydroxyphosphoribosylaminopyrimidine deaminase/5-amino-6-(5-phosphoribosylamino)uracil reductase